jgi:hypothetical protein
MLVCFFHLHARLRAHQAPGIPCALCILGEWFMHNSGALRRENAVVCPSLRATKQSSFLSCCGMDCFASLAMTALAMDCFAEPVIGRAARDPLARNDAYCSGVRATLSG